MYKKDAEHEYSYTKSGKRPRVYTPTDRRDGAHGGDTFAGLIGDGTGGEIDSAVCGWISSCQGRKSAFSAYVAEGIFERAGTDIGDAAGAFAGAQLCEGHERGH